MNCFQNKDKEKGSWEVSRAWEVKGSLEGGRGGVLTQWRAGIPPLSPCSGDPAPRKLELSLYNDALEKEGKARFQLQPKLPDNYLGAENTIILTRPTLCSD